ncbi:hypothetical protein GCM10023329_07060 [Streptomyces sanyensis]|uniref:Uncharacterized protein n=1 Tax=Streptomyces sanyensis TaxID=568869 RepID=A0ABP8ZRY8_9ACTN
MRADLRSGARAGAGAVRRAARPAARCASRAPPEEGAVGTRADPRGRSPAVSDSFKTTPGPGATMAV